MSKLKICRDITLLHPFVQKRALEVLESCRKAGLDVEIFETLRTQERQNFLKAKGKSKTLNSYHILGLAVDFVFKKNGKWSWSSEHDWDALANIVESRGFKSGWRWTTFKDGPHSELRFQGVYTKELFQKLRSKNYDYEEFFKQVNFLIIKSPLLDFATDDELEYLYADVVKAEQVYVPDSIAVSIKAEDVERGVPVPTLKTAVSVEPFGIAKFFTFILNLFTKK